jgi:hypothetical protein
MALRFLTILTGQNLPIMWRQSKESERSIINEKTIADFIRWPSQSGSLTTRVCQRQNCGYAVLHRCLEIFLV